jgi:apolipoprotein N-acyltransferase
VISFEIFFSDRARSGIRAGGQILLAPTNTASYATTQVPAAEIATARLRAWETGRDVVMAAPTGFSAVIDAHGRVRQRSRLGRREVLTAVVHRRTGTTPYLGWGDLPALALGTILVAGSWLVGLLDRAVNSGKP